MITEADGYRWEAEPGTDDSLGPGGHESNLEPVLRGLLGGGAFLDAGAHVGHWAIRLAAQAGAVIAVEANPDTAAVLRVNIALNGLESSITVLEAAAWDSRAVLRLGNPVDSRTRSACTRTIPCETGGTVQGLPLDDLLDPALDISLVKLDVEGADLHALRGMAGMLARCRPVLFIERHDSYGCYTIGEMHGLLAGLGYGWADGPESCGSKYLICHPDGSR